MAWRYAYQEKKQFESADWPIDSPDVIHAGIQDAGRTATAASN